MIVRSLAAMALMLPGVAGAQVLSCAIPGAIPRPHPDLPSESQPARRLPIGSYTLAITWNPEFCRNRGDDAANRFQCGGTNRFGFTLHGLWPDGIGKDWPQYCRATPILSRQVIRRHLCSTPSAQLMQHEWAKHGTCMAGYTPDRYFARSTTMYGRLRFPDMDALSRQTLTAGTLADAIARANPGMAPDMMRITATRQGWLDEVWLCTDRRFRYTRCPAHQGGLSPDAAVKIWRGRR
ncbi:MULTISPECIES: ribonuclease T2 family protein [Sphingomonas]|uniref:Ribonuclease T n=1 Tax=Sphingomonas adhaesiva TaxID=28212 RepID=A0A2A4IAI0_9SPHN|nr:MULTISPECIES: ribonuclease T [Sphingomonas]PCG15519.1 ribonuclease T [Sphingomonas adhaesiva]PZU80217.1 MAG: ribonuclease T [Sphingomonas sp.]